MEKHLPVVAWLNIGHSVLGLLGGLIGFIILFGISLVPEVFHEEVSWLLRTISMVVLIGIGITALPGIIGGIGILQRKNWGRIVVIIVSFFNLLGIPFGTALGIYSLYVLLKEETAQLFNGKTAMKIQL